MCCNGAAIIKNSTSDILLVTPTIALRHKKYNSSALHVICKTSLLQFPPFGAGRGRCMGGEQVEEGDILRLQNMVVIIYLGAVMPLYSSMSSAPIRTFGLGSCIERSSSEQCLDDSARWHFLLD